MEWREYISVDPNVCHGQACVEGTRVMVSIVLDNLADGMTHEELLRDYLSLTEQSIQAVLAYAAELARERVVNLTA